jgi:tetratricopeptide repeat protein
VTGITKLAPQAEVDAAVAPLVGKRLVLHPAPPFPLAEIRLAEWQVQVIEALRQRPRLDELAAATGLPPDEMTRLVYALAVVGTVTTADLLNGTGAVAVIAGTGRGSRPAGAVPAAPASPATPPTPILPQAPTAGGPAAAPAPVPGGPPARSSARPAVLAPATGSPSESPAGTGAGAGPSVAEVERLRNEVMQAYLSYRKQDAFDLLGLPEDATPPLIDERYLVFAARYAPGQFTAPAFGQLGEKARDLFLAGARAYSQLADREQRETLLFRRKTLREERARRPADFAIKTDLLDPEVQYRKGKASMEAGKLREAIQQLEFASDCDPQNGLYRAELAWCRFQHSPTGATRQAIEGLEQALRIDPRCGLAHYYLGEIHRQLGNAREAEELLQKAIRLMAPDRRPIEALKALQSKKKR